MSNDSVTYLTELNELLDNYFNLREIESLRFQLGVIKEFVAGSEKSVLIRGLLNDLGQDGRLPELVALTQKERPNVAWPAVPDDFEMPESLDELAVWDGRVPYLGLNAYQERDAGFFFGREGLVDELLERVERARFVTIAGPSGSGKSSVARAGLFHALRQGRLEHSETWLLATMQPKGDPIEQLALAIDRMERKPGTAGSIRDNGLDDPLALHTMAETLLTDDKRQRFGLLVDQFEETFTQTRDEEERSAFIDLLTTTAGVEDGRVVVVISLRSDFVSNCAGYDELRALMSQEFQLVGSMKPRDLAKAITLPSLEVGAEIEPALVKQIIDDMKGEPGALPLMSFAMLDLFEAQKTAEGEPMTLTLEEYLQRGGIESALERHANAVFAAFAEEQQALAKGIFSRLITVGEGGVDARRTASFEELVPAGGDPEAVATVVGMLAAEGARLVTTSGVEEEELTAEEVDGAETAVTIAHEKLIEAWPWLRQLIDENRELIALRNLIIDEAKRWEKEGDDGYLLRGGRLNLGEENLNTLLPNLDELSLSFIQASIEARQAEVKAEEERIRQQEALRQEEANASRFRKLTNWLGIVTVIAVIASALALLFMNTARNEATMAATSEAEAIVAKSTSDANAQLASSREAEARYAEDRANISADLAVTREAEAIEAQGTSDFNAKAAATSEAEVAMLKNRIQASQLAAASGVELEKDQELALLLATAGLGLSPQPDTIANFNAAIFTPFRLTLYGHQEEVTSAEFSPDGQRIITASEDGSAKIWGIEGNELASLDGHGGPVWSVSFSPDGNRIVTASSDGTAKIWDQDGTELASLDGHTVAINEASFSPDGQRIVTAGQEEIKVWDLDGKELASLDGHEFIISSARFSPYGQKIVTASWDNRAKLWDLSGNELVSLDGHTGEVWTASFSPDGQHIVTASKDGSAKLWDQNGIEIASLDGGGFGVWAASYSPDGKRIVTGHHDGRAKLWDNSGNELVTINGHDGAVTSVGFSPDGTSVFTASTDGNIKIWDLFGNEIVTLEGHMDEVKSADFSPDGQKIVSASSDGEAKVWDVSGNELSSLEGHPISVWSAIFSHDGRHIVTAGCDALVDGMFCTPYSAKVWDLTGNELAYLDGFEGSLHSAFFSPNDKNILTTGYIDGVKIWDTEGNKLASLDGHEGRVTSAEFSLDGRKILTAGVDGSVKVWDTKGNEQASFDVHEDGVISAVFSPDGRKILTADGGDAKMWSLEGKELASFEGHEGGVELVEFSPDGSKVLTANTEGDAKLWDLEGVELASLEGHTDSLRSAVFSQSGQKILTTSIVGSVKLWDVEGNEMASLDRQEGDIISAVFSPDDRLIATASSDGSVDLWDIEGNEVASLKGHESYVISVVFNPDGQQILSASWDGSAKIWAIYPSVEEKVVVARERLSKGFSNEECRRFFRDDPDSCPRTLEELFALFDDDLQGP